MRILVELPLPDAVLGDLRAFAEVRETPFHDRPWEADAALIGFDPHLILCKWPPSNLDAFRSLRLIQIATVGYDHLRDRGFATSPVTVCNARGVFDTAIAEWNVAMMINLVRDLRQMIRNQDAGVFAKEPRFMEDVRGRVVGIWGYGGIGRQTARLARALGMTVRVLTRNGVSSRATYWVPEGTGDPEGAMPHRVYVAGEKEEFLSGLDFLILALPHTQESDGMVGAAELRALPPSAFVLNPARGPIIKEEAMLAALRDGTIAGAAIDTHWAYPLPAEHPLWKFPNVIVTPHISGSDRASRYAIRMGELFLANARRYHEGSSPLNVVTKREWEEA